MRMRAKRNRDTRYLKVADLFAKKESEHIVVDENRPLYIEIGCGKGAFCIGLAQKNSDAQIIAMELSADALLMAMEKANQFDLPNLSFLNCNAEDIDKLFAARSVDRIYLNFSDPWPKSKHAKRRLTAPQFLNRYKTVLKSGGEIYFKTDNRGLFDYSLSTFAECGFAIDKVLFDLHSSELNDENIRTEYENNFSAKGFKINYIKVHFDAK